MRGRMARGLATLMLVVSLGAAAQKPTSAEAKPTRMGPNPAPVKQATRKAKTKPYQVGTASWYGDYFEGRPTASGEPFDMYDLTAAHPTLPLGSYVRVTNLRNGRAVVVRVNDRGPVVEGRIIDLSYNAARVLGFKDRGLQQVRVDLVHAQTYAQLRPLAN